MENQNPQNDGANAGLETTHTPIAVVPQADAGGASVSHPSRARRLRSGGFIRIVAFAGLGLLVLGGGAYAFLTRDERQANNINTTQPSNDFEVQNIPLSDLVNSGSVGLSTIQSLSINGQLRANNSLVIAPTDRPTQGTVGQVYYDKTGNALAYYDGAKFVDLAGTDDVAELQAQLNAVRASIPQVPAVQAIPQGIATQSGDNTFTGTNSFTNPLSAASLTLSGSATLQGALSVNGPTNLSSASATSLNVSGATNLGSTTISSLLLSSPLGVGSGGTGNSSFTNNGLLIGQGSSPLATVNAAGPGLCLISTAGAPTFQSCPGGGAAVVDSLNGLTGNLTLSNATGVGSTITIDNASTAAKGIASFSATNFSVSSGAVNTIQDISVTSSPTFNALSLTTPLSVASGGTGVNTLPNNGVLIGQGAGALTGVTAGSSGLCLVSTAGAPSFQACPGSGGVASLNGLTGALTVNDATTAGSAIIINDATTSSKGIASFNATNFLVSGGAVNVVQNINTTAAPTFAGLTVNGTINGQTISNVANFTGSLAVAGALNANTITPTGAMTIGSTGQSVLLQGNASTTLSATSAGITNSLVFATPAGSNKNITLPNASGTVAVSASGPLALDANGNISCPTCATTGGPAAVDSLNGLTGALILSNATGAGSTITIDDASTTAKGIASFNSTNFTVASGVVNTIQNLSVTSSPTFAGLTVNGSVNLGGNSIVTSGATIGSSELDVLDGGITELEVTGVITDVTAGNGLTGGAAAGNATVNIASANGGITVNADNIALTLQPAGDGLSTTTSSGSGLEILSSGLTLLQGCGDGQILKWNEATDTWSCAADAGGSGVGDDLFVNGSNADGANFLNTVASGTSAGVTWGLNTVSAPDDITLTVSNASATEAGVVTTGVQGFAGDKTFNNAVTVAGLFTANGDVTIQTGDTFTLNGDGFTDLTGTGLVVIGSALQASLGTSIDSSEIDNLTITGADIANDTIDLGTKTTGNYVSGNTGGTGIAITGTAGEGWSPTISLDYSNTLSSNSLGVNQSSFAATGILFEGTLADGFETLLALANPTADNTITLPDASGAVCLSSGNCAGAGGGVTTSGGTTNRLAKFSAAQNIESSTITDDGSNVTTSVSLIIQGGNVTAGTNAQLGSFILNDGNGQTTTLRAGDSAGNLTFTLPTAAGSQYQCLKYDTGGQLIWDNCDGGGGGGSGVTALNGLSGGVTIQGSAQIGVNAASPNIDLSIVADSIGDSQLAFNTGQHLTTTSAPTFAGITLNGNLTVGTNSIVTGLTTISSTELDVLDGGISESEVTGVVTDVTAGNGLTGGAASGNATLNIASANGAIAVNADNIALTLQPTGDALSATTSSGSGLEILAGGLSLLQGCGNNQVLKWDEATDMWVCANDVDTDTDTGDEVSINGTGTAGTNFINSIVSGSSAGVTWNLNTTPSPDEISITISNASASEAGVVTTGVQSFAGVKTFDAQIIANGGINLGAQTLQGTTSVIDFTNFDVLGNGNTTIGGTLTVTGTSALNGDVTVAAGKSLTVTGGATGTRPASPSEGMIYFDTTTKQLLTYTNGKWQADRSTATKIVASGGFSGCSGSVPVASANPDGADYVTNSCTSAQTAINSAISALPANGGTVYLMEGTYIIDAPISVVSNLRIIGAGQGTIIKLKNGINADINAIENTSGTKTGVTVSDLKLDGNKANNSSGNQRGVNGSLIGTTSSPGLTVRDAYIENFRNQGIYAISGVKAIVAHNFITLNGADGIHLNGVNNATVSENEVRGSTTNGGVLTTGTGVTISNNKVVGNTGYGISASGDRTTVTGNTVDSNTTTGITMGGSNGTVTGNTIYGSGNGGILLTTSTSYTTVSGNTVANSGTHGIYVYNNSTNNIVSGNTVANSGTSSTGSSGIIIDANCDNTSVVNNRITDTAGTGHAIYITGPANDTVNAYLADNTFSGTGASSINDQGTNTIYGGQVNSSGNFMIQPSGTIELLKNTNVTGTLNITSDVDTNGSLTVGNANQFVVSNLGVVTSGTWQGGALQDAYVADNLTISSSGTVDWAALNNYPAACAAGSAITQLGDTITCQAFASSSGSGNYIQNQFASQQTTADFWISGTGRADTVLQAPTFDTATATTLTLGGNATSISVVDDTVLAAGKSLTVTGGATGTRPASPTEGMIYFDTTTKQLLTYTNGKWQADRTDSVIVAASNSSQADKDAADYVADGNTGAAADGDQVQINAALTAASGKKVVLLAGTYVADATILIPNNTTLAGVGNGTLIELADIDASDNLIENSDTTTGTGVVIRDLKISGRDDLNTLGTQHGVFLNGMGDATTARQGAKLTNVTAINFRNTGIYLNNSDNNTVRDSRTQGNREGILLDASAYNTLSGNSSDGDNDGITIYTGSTNNSVANNKVQNSDNTGIYIWNTANHNTITGNVINNASDIGILAFGSSSNTITGNTSHSNGSHGISIASGVTSSIISGNTTYNNVASGIYIYHSTTTGNTFTGNTSRADEIGVYLDGAIGNAISNNAINDSLDIGVLLSGGNSNSATDNRIRNSGGATTNDAIVIQFSDANTITSNTITDTSATTDNYAINITGATSDNNYLSGNTLGTGSINNLGTGTVFGGQVNSSGNYVIQPAGTTIELMKNTNITGTLTVTSSVDTNGSLTVGTADQFVVSSAGVVTAGTWQGGAIQDAYVADNLTISGSGTVDWAALNNYPAACAAGSAVTQLGDSVTCTAFAAASGSANYIQNQNASAQATASFWISGTGRAETGILTPLIDSLPGGSLDVGTNAQGINLNAHVIVASDKVILLSGGNTASRIGTAQEGMIYYDTDTKKLVVYSNGKWQADRSDAILVAASNSTQAEKDAADFVADGNTGVAADGDQVEINAALTAASGKKVVLLPGTYVADAGILVPNNTTLTGVGNGTKIQLADIDVSANLISNSDTTTGTGVTIRDLMLDGQKSLNTAGTQRGVYLTGVGNAADRPGALVEGVTAQNFNFAGIDVGASSQNITINNNTVISNYSGIRVGSGSATYITVSNNTANSNTTNGIDVNVSSRGADVTGNTVNSNGEYGIEVGDNGTVSSNTVSNNTLNGIHLQGADNNIISSNYVYNNGGSSGSHGIHLGNSDANQIIGNRIIDTAGTGQAINIGDSGCANNYVADNVYSGTGATSIVNGGTGTIFGGQVNSAGNYLIQPAGTVELMKNTNVTGTLTATALASTVATGTAPLTVNSTTLVANLNVDMLDGQSGSFYQDAGNINAGTLAVNRGGTGASTFTQYGILFGNGTGAFGVTAAGTTGQCLLATTSAAPTWGACTPTTLQGSYDGSSPATINLTDSKNFTINAADTATDSSIVFNLQCSTCSAGGGRFAVQDAGVDIFSINPNGDIIIGTAANNMTLVASNGYKPVLSGTARNSKTIRLHAEYPSVVLTADGSNNTGTLTSGYDNTSSARMNYYKWTTTQGSNQDYDIVVQVPLPADFDGWDTSNPLAVTAYTSNTTNGTITLEARDSSDAQICNFVSITPGSTGTWATNNTACTLSTGTYTAGNYVTIRIKLQSPNGGDTRVGNIVLNYKSKF